MMKKIVFLFLICITSFFCYADGYTPLNGTTMAPILLYDNGNGIQNIFDNIGYVLGEDYEIWNDTYFNDYNSVVSAGFQVIVTGSGTDYGTLATQMQADRTTWLSNAGKVVLSGQKVDVNSEEFGAVQFAQNIIEWAKSGYTYGQLGFVAFADTGSLWNWTPWLNPATTEGRGTAALESGDTVNFDAYAAHPVNEYLYSGDLSNWANGSYGAFFTALPQDFNIVGETGNGDALTIINAPVIITNIPEPTSLMMFVFGILLGFWGIYRKA